MSVGITICLHKKSFVPQLKQFELIFRQEEIINILEQTEELSLKDINQQLSKQIPDSTLRKDLAKLKKMGIISSRGQARATTWFLIKKESH